MNPQYRFYIRVNSTSATATEVYPVWKDDLSLDYARESQQMFFRTSLSGSIDFVNEDYDFLINKTFSALFYFEIQISDNGASWSHYWWGKFYKTDCKIDMDNKKITVKPDVVDQYTDILAGLEKEYDLIKLAPEIEKIIIRKRPCLQIYDEGDDTVSCIFSNISFEQDANLPSDESNVEAFLRDRCHFCVVSSFAELDFTSVPSSQEAYFAEPFTGSIIDGHYLNNTTYYYTILYWESYEDQQIDNITVRRYKNGLKIFRVGDATTDANIKWKFEQEKVSIPGDEYEALPVEITFTSMVEGVGDLVAVRTSQTVYARLLCNVEAFGSHTAFELYSDDLISYNRNYRRACPWDVTIYQSQRHTSTATEWGRRDDGDYYLPPDDTNEYIPIGRSRWANVSLWFQKTDAWMVNEENATDAYMLNDAYPLHTCISRLLEKVAPSISFSNTDSYSQFFYREVSDVYSDPIAGRDTRLYITPKSNITAGEYQTPAQTAPITLKDIFDMLRKTYQLYWFVDSYSRLRIEHVKYFENGGSYTMLPGVGINLTAMTALRRGKPYSYDTNVYEYDKPDMAERYQFGWMDEVTEPFKGQAIDIRSVYVTKGKIEEIDVANFSSDIDYMLLNPSAISPDGFAVMNIEEADAIVGDYEYLYVDGQLGSVIPIASYVRGKTCGLHLSCTTGSGTVTLVWVTGERRETSTYVISVPNNVMVQVDVPDGVTGISFIASDSAWIHVWSLKIVGAFDMVQLPMDTYYYQGNNIRMQNGLLSFFKLQDPYWLYDMPAGLLTVNGAPETALSIKKGKRQTVNIPVGMSDPDMLELVTTGLGNGQIRSMSIRLTSRMAKTELRYDTES